MPPGRPSTISVAPPTRCGPSGILWAFRQGAKGRSRLDPSKFYAPRPLDAGRAAAARRRRENIINHIIIIIYGHELPPDRRPPPEDRAADPAKNHRRLLNNSLREPSLELSVTGRHQGRSHQRFGRLWARAARSGSGHPLKAGVRGFSIALGESCRGGTPALFPGSTDDPRDTTAGGNEATGDRSPRSREPTSSWWPRGRWTLIPSRRFP